MFFTFSDIKFIDQFSKFTVEHVGGSSYVICGVGANTAEIKDPLSDVVAEVSNQASADILAELFNRAAINTKTA